MGILKRAKATAALSRKAEELLYEQALNEYETGEIRRGLWAQALAEAQGDESRAMGHYMKLRVRSLVDEGAIVEQLVESSANRQGNSAAINHEEQATQPEVGVAARIVFWLIITFGVVLLVVAVILTAMG